MSLAIIMHIACDNEDCSNKATIPAGVTVEYHRAILRNKGWHRIAAIQSSRSGPTSGGKDFCPRHAKLVGSAR